MQDNFVDPCNIAEVTIVNYVDLYIKVMNKIGCYGKWWRPQLWKVIIDDWLLKSKPPIRKWYLLSKPVSKSYFKAQKHKQTCTKTLSMQ